uniref:Glucosylceramidase n=1 Tax=Romanomermis culicivorax TaxID=13658 RepID=A0A915HZ26_ROMCU
GTLGIHSILDIPCHSFYKKIILDKGGIGYNIGRIPIASCDFSTSNYSYDDIIDDMDLKHFSLTEEDTKFKIPFIKKARILTGGSLRLFGSAWSAPFWMKTNHMMEHGGTLLGKPGGPYYKAYANYLIRFLDEYRKRGVKFWSLTVVNEPSSGFGYDTTHTFQSLGFTPQTQRDFIKLDLGPALEKSGRKNFKIMIMDDNKLTTLEWTIIVSINHPLIRIMSDLQAAKYVSHVAVHWYLNRVTPFEIIDMARSLFPNVSFMGTEACNGWRDHKVIIGSWERAENYAKDIVKNLNHWYTGWIDWNMVLDLNGGPSWVSNFVDSPILVNATSSEFYKQPTYYALGHFSTFLVRGSKRSKITSDDRRRRLLTTAFLTPAGHKVVIITNTNDVAVTLNLKDKDMPKVKLRVNIEKHSIKTIIWN